MKTIDQEYRKRFLLLLLEAIRKGATTGFSFEDLRPEDLLVIEYYLKDCAINPVSEFTSKERCGGLFIEKVRGIFKGNQDELHHFREFILLNLELLSKKESEKLRDYPGLKLVAS